LAIVLALRLYHATIPPLLSAQWLFFYKIVFNPSVTLEVLGSFSKTLKIILILGILPSDNDLVIPR
jgi:hypothetical protein